MDNYLPSLNNFDPFLMTHLDHYLTIFDQIGQPIFLIQKCWHNLTILKLLSPAFTHCYTFQQIFTFVFNIFTHLDEIGFFCFPFNPILEDTARYAGLLLAPAEGFSLRPRLFLPFGQIKSLLCCFGPFLAFFGVQ